MKDQVPTSGVRSEANETKLAADAADVSSAAESIRRRGTNLIRKWRPGEAVARASMIDGRNARSPVAQPGR